jgi:protein gp37
MGKTSIQWTDYSVNPIRARHRDTGKTGWHCIKHSTGCAHCYAEALNIRFGTGLPFLGRSSDAVELQFDPRPMLPLIRLTRPSRVFPCDMTDLFQDAVPVEMIATMYAFMSVMPWHTFQVLTKRAKRMDAILFDPEFPCVVGTMIHQKVLPAIAGKQRIKADCESIAILAHALRSGSLSHGMTTERGYSWPPRNIWQGVSVEDMAMARDRIGFLMATPAALRFLSVEPMLERIELFRFNPDEGRLVGPAVMHDYGHQPSTVNGPEEFFDSTYPGIDWVIVGGESGVGARPCDIAWVLDIIDQCREAEVPVFIKQLGSNVVSSGHLSSLLIGPARAGSVVVTCKRVLRDGKGGDPSEWPENLRIREFPEVS